MKVILLMMKMAENEVTSFEDDFLNPADDVVEVVIAELKSHFVATVTEGDLERDKDFFITRKMLFHLVILVTVAQLQGSVFSRVEVEEVVEK